MTETTEPERRGVYLVRHALTQGNLVGVRLGSIDEPLVPEGRDQARALARRAEGLDLEEVWSSPLARARETAAIVAGHLGVPHLLDDDLREIGLGPWEGLREDEIAERFPTAYRTWQVDPGSLRLPGHETVAELRERVARSIERITRRTSRGLAVTHLAAMRAAWLHFTGRPTEAFAGIAPGHCELLRLEGTGAPGHEAGGWTLVDPVEVGTRS